jgi:NAD(P)-dependent dehydrogenase (short-subunit alcohol dehydrogenase family)
VAFLSSRTGSISLNDTGDMELYRASKAALNSLSRSFAVKDALPVGVGVLLLHPGWVQTDMGGDDAPVTLAESVEGLRRVLLASLDDPAHRFLDYKGATIDW